MKYAFPRYIYGMLQTPDGNNVYGDLQPIAYSGGFSETLQREVYKKIRLGLNGDMLQNTGNAYGFFSISDVDFIIAHYQLMGLTEPTSRGKPVFSEYFHVTSSQLEEMDWNIYPIFKAFTNIHYYEKIERDIAPIEIEFIDDDLWMDNLRQFPVQAEAILVRYLSSSEKINITSAPDDFETRLKLLCSVFQCLPQDYRKDMSFATLAKETTDSARVFFSSNQSGNGRVLDWTAPTIPNLPGVVYANWVVDLIGKSKADSFKELISNLKLPNKTENLKTLGDGLDLTIKYKDWYANRNEHIKVKVLAQLEQLARQINEFSIMFTTQEAEDWLTLVMIFVMKLTAYDIGSESLSYYTSIIVNEKTRHGLVQKIVDKIFIQQTEENLEALAGFIIHLTDHSTRTNQEALSEFCKEILTQCLGSKEYRSALILWARTKHLAWAKPVTWFETALATLPPTLTKEDFVFIVNDIGCSANKHVFDSLLVSLKTSPDLSNHLPENKKFLETQIYDNLQNYLEQVLNCFFEIKSYKWLATQIRFGYGNFPNFLEEFPLLIERIDAATVDNLLLHTVSEKDDLLTIFVAFSKILNQIRGDNSTTTDKYLKLVKERRPEYIDLGIVILQNHWSLFPVQQLELLLNVLDSKLGKYQNINLSAKEIRINIQKKNRVANIQNLFKRKIKENDIGHIIFEFVSDFLRSSDIDAWCLFEKHMRDRRFLNEYHKLLIQILLENLFFKIEDYKLKEISITLRDAELLYEADVFVYWLYFQRGIIINPISSIRRTLSLSCVQPSEAGMIISQRHIFDKKYTRSLANKLVQMDPVESKKLTEKLDNFVTERAPNSFENRIRSLISDLTPDVIWVENCKALSKCIKSELSKPINRRN